MVIDAKEMQSGIYGATLTDENGHTISSGTLSSFTITLYDKLSRVIINSRNAQNALNANQVTLDTNGIVTWVWLPLDMPVLNSNREIEEHVALFTAKWTDGAGRPRQANHEVLFRVERIEKLA